MGTATQILYEIKTMVTIWNKKIIVLFFLSYYFRFSMNFGRFTVEQLTTMFCFFSRVVILIVFIKESSEFCPSKCTCDLDFFVSCSNAMLDVVPIQLNPTVKYLNLTNNNISAIHSSLIFYLQLEYLDLGFNSFEELKGNDFQQLERLLVLVMNNNYMKELKNRAFAGLFELLQLDLSYNKISLIQPNSFSNLQKLLWLDLSFNKISYIDGNFFKHLRNLEWLSLRNNVIVNIASYENQHHLSALRHVDLSMNLLEYINASDLSSFRTVVWLNLSNNLLSDQSLLSLQYLSHMKVLDLSHNFFTVSIK